MAKRIVWTDQARADIRSIEQPIALQILTGEGRTKQLQGVMPPLIRLRAQNHRVFFRDKGDYLEIDRVLDRCNTLDRYPPAAVVYPRHARRLSRRGQITGPRATHGTAASETRPPLDT